MRQAWQPLGFVWGPQPHLWWSQAYAILPTPLALDSETIRIFYGTTDKEIHGRVAYVDVAAMNPLRVVAQSEIVLDLGEPGRFDDCGVNPAHAFKENGELYLTFAGYQRHQRSPYSLFTGLAKWNHELNIFERVSPVPLLDRTPGESILRSAGVRFQNKLIYVSGDTWTTSANSQRQFPTYSLFEAQSDLKTSRPGTEIIKLEPKEVGLGRPWIVEHQGKTELWFSSREQHEGVLTYKTIGRAEKRADGSWQRREDDVGLKPGGAEWCSQSVCYPAVIDTAYGRYLFYNGNQNGKTGFGVAIWRG